MSGYEPGLGEVVLTLLIGGTIARPIYRRYINTLDLASGDCVLDYGSGSGVCSKFLARRLQNIDGHLTCLDVSRRWQTVIQKMLNRYSNVDYLIGDIVVLAIPASSFDALLSHFVIHDIPATERMEIVREWARMLKPGGKVFLREPVSGSEGIALDELGGLMRQNGFVEAASCIVPLPLMGDTFEGTFLKAFN